MRAVFGQAAGAGSLFSGAVGSSSLDVWAAPNAVVVKRGPITFIVEGDFYYAVRDGGTVSASSGDLSSLIAGLLAEGGPESVAARLEGTFVAAWHDSDRGAGGVLSDTLNRRPLYVVQDRETLLATTELEEAVDAAGARGRFNQQALYSYLVLGYPGARETFYTGVSRLGPDEFIRLSASGVETTTVRDVRPIEEFGREQLDEYDRRIHNAIDSRASGTGNVVMNSGGWDSTSLISLLREGRDASTVRSVVFDVLLPDGQSFNIYEVDKAKRIAGFFGIEAFRAVIDYSDRTLLEYWQEALGTLRSNHMYFWLHHLKLADTVAEVASTEAGVFNGEASDSIHNFGYSQFVSVNYENMYLREYADKAKSYLYGPTFFAKLGDGTFKDDKVLRFFHGYYGKDRFEPSEGADARTVRERYFGAFMLSYPRVPFARWQSSAIAQTGLQSSFADSLRAGSMKGAIDEATPQTLYYWLLQLYREFHFQSYQIGINHVATGRRGMRCNIPFLDMQMLDYMYRMPEDWGRGLELRTTKYPLRYLATERWRMPIHILEEAGPHSYIAENDPRWTYAGGSWSIYCEIMYKSVFADFFRDLLATQRLEDVFDPAQFDIPAMRQTIRDYADGVERPADVGLLFKLGVLFSIGLYS